MKDARQRKFDAVLVWKFDRFARSTKHLLIALEEFKASGIDFISYTEAFDTSSPIGEAMFTVIGAMAKLERDLISERVRAGMRKAKADGKKVGRPPIEVDIEKVLGLVGEGKSLRQIARELGISKSKVWSVLQEHSVQKASINYGK
jgi:DNA invertase Pin-like site-specific DNA recombinase